MERNASETGRGDPFELSGALGTWSLCKGVNRASVGVGMRGESREPEAQGFRQAAAFPAKPGRKQGEMTASLPQETSYSGTSLEAFLPVCPPLSSSFSLCLCLSRSPPLLSLPLPPFSSIPPSNQFCNQYRH